MKVLDLQCGQQHVFEGWFASEEDFVSQLDRGLLSCPVCGDLRVQKMLSAPRLNLRGGRNEPAASAPASPASPAPVQGGERVRRSAAVAGPSVAAFQAQLLQAMRQVVASAEDVGERFADQARAMHHGEIESRNIRGRTSADVAMELVEEGIEVLPLPDLSVLKETLQ
jgi:hypothetical protein